MQTRPRASLVFALAMYAALHEDVPLNAPDSVERQGTAARTAVVGDEAEERGEQGELAGLRSSAGVRASPILVSEEGGGVLGKGGQSRRSSSRCARGQRPLATHINVLLALDAQNRINVHPL